MLDFLQRPGTALRRVVANLFLHHFDGDAAAPAARARRDARAALRRLRAAALAPARSARAGCSALIGCNDVTRHDAVVSVRAGFRGERALARCGRAAGGWTLSERPRGRSAISSWRGAMRRLTSLVIGGGPAGATAAMLLARAGRSVAVLEKAAFPRRKVCGEFIAAHAVELLQELGFENPGTGWRSAVSRCGPGGGHRRRAIAAALCAHHRARRTRSAYFSSVPRACGARVFQPAAALRLRAHADGNRVHRQAVARNRSARDHRRARLLGAGQPADAAAAGPAAAGRRISFAFKAHFRGCALPPGTIALVPFPGGYAGVVEIGGGRATLRLLHPPRSGSKDCARRDCRLATAVLRYASRMSRGRCAKPFEGAVRAGPWLSFGSAASRRPAARPRRRFRARQCRGGGAPGHRRGHRDRPGAPLARYASRSSRAVLMSRSRVATPPRGARASPAVTACQPCSPASRCGDGRRPPPEPCSAGVLRS